MQQQIQKQLIEMADEKYKKFHSNLCPGINNILGIKVPILRQYAKELIKQGEWRKVLEWKNTDYYEEVMLQGLIIGLAKLTLEETIEYLEKFIPKIDNWAVCDIVCAGLKITKKYPKEMWDLIGKYLQSKREFELRFAVVMILDFYITEKDINEVFKILDNIKHEGYYVKMAIAWTVSVAYIKFSELTLNYLKENNLDIFTHNKAIQKIIESKRVSKEEKKNLRKLKKQ